MTSPDWWAERVVDVLPDRRLCWLLVLCCGAVFAGLAFVLVPWSWAPGHHIEPVRPASVFSAAQLHRMESYSGMQRHLGWASLAVSLIVALILGATRVGAWLAARLRGPWLVRVSAMTLLVVLAGDLITLPLALKGRGNALDYGLTNQPISGWLRDRAISLGLSWIFAFVLVLSVLVAARRSPRRWPMWTALAGVVLTVGGSWLYPVVVEPMFNRFTPLEAGPLRTQIMTLARREGVPVSEVLVADASRRTTTLNAYVSGFGSTRRVVLYDNLVDDIPRREALLVVAHELGHARHHDVLVGTMLAALGVAGGAGLLGLVLRSPLIRRRAGVSSIARPEAVALVLLLVNLGLLLVSPLENTISRAVEARADRASLEATRDLAGFEAMQRRLAVRSLSDPTPPAWSQFCFGSHPTSIQRIAVARALLDH